MMNNFTKAVLAGWLLLDTPGAHTPRRRPVISSVSLARVGVVPDETLGWAP